jgi:hypothetical protein
MGDIIIIRNKLEIQPGNVINVPGCEPTTSLTSDTLSRNLKCNASIIPVEDVLRLIPGSRIVRVLSPFGQTGTGMFLELPSGPPQNGNECPAECIPDWYAVLRKHARVRNTDEDEEPTPVGMCAGVNFSGCVFDYDPTLHPRAGNHRPSERPIGVGGPINEQEIRPSEMHIADLRPSGEPLGHRHDLDEHGRRHKPGHRPGHRPGPRRDHDNRHDHDRPDHDDRHQFHQPLGDNE